jgi:hypothetical protein
VNDGRHSVSLVFIFFCKFSAMIFVLGYRKLILEQNFSVTPTDSILEVPVEVLTESVVIGKIKVKVKLSLCLTKHHAIKAYWGNGGIAPRIL